MDYLFTTKKTVFEVGCGECVLVGGIKTTKEFQDAGFKMPKLMRDMANSILATYAGLENELCLVGYYIGGDAMQLLTLDFPAGYVARLDGFGPVHFPRNEEKICSLQNVVKLILSDRILMENAYRKIERCQMTPIGRLGHVSDCIVHTFAHAAAPVSDKKKKKKMPINNLLTALLSKF
ncbi:hypothetical protein PS15p_211439 [Mucor circinelloides]